MNGPQLWVECERNRNQFDYHQHPIQKASRTGSKSTLAAARLSDHRKTVELDRRQPGTSKSFDAVESFGWAAHKLVLTPSDPYKAAPGEASTGARGSKPTKGNAAPGARSGLRKSARGGIRFPSLKTGVQPHSCALSHCTLLHASPGYFLPHSTPGTLYKASTTAAAAALPNRPKLAVCRSSSSSPA